MRKEPFAVGSYVHVIKRGARGSVIVRDDTDRMRFLKLLRYLNDANVPRNWERDITNEHTSKGFSRPVHWVPSSPYVSVISYCLLDNHFHMLLREKIENGVSKFMQRLCTSMSLYYNLRYKGRGTLFEGAYLARTVSTDRHLQHLNTYIQVKNAFELFPGGIRKAMRAYDDALRWAEGNPFVSLGEYAGCRRTELLDHQLITEIFPNYAIFRKSSRDIMHSRMETPGDLRRLLIDDDI